MKIALRQKQKMVDRSCSATVGTETLLAVANLIKVLKYGDKTVPNNEIAPMFQRARDVVLSRKELAKLCKEAVEALAKKS